MTRRSFEPTLAERMSTRNYGGVCWRIDLGPCCAKPRLINLVTNGRKEAKCAACETVRPRE
jgi:uncharacterized protein YhfF